MDNQFLPIEQKKDTSVTNKRQIQRGAISKAIYMVTELFDDGEPLKLALRNTAVDMLKDNSSYHTLQLKSLLVLSREIGLISEMNTDIIIRAINSVEADVSTLHTKIDISSVLKQSEVVAESHTESAPYVPSHSIDNVQNHTEITELKEVRKETVSNPETDTITKKLERPTQTQSVSTTLDIGTRRKKILEVVRSKGQATIHEFTQSIQGCSSKTIQRELTSLVLSGTLKKTGERRWSKYSLR